jgi:hypothetical protein
MSSHIPTCWPYFLLLCHKVLQDSISPWSSCMQCWNSAVDLQSQRQHEGWDRLLCLWVRFRSWWCWSVWMDCDIHLIWSSVIRSLILFDPFTSGPLFHIWILLCSGYGCSLVLDIDISL